MLCWFPPIWKNRCPSRIVSLVFLLYHQFYILARIRRMAIKKQLWNHHLWGIWCIITWRDAKKHTVKCKRSQLFSLSPGGLRWFFGNIAPLQQNERNNTFSKRTSFWHLGREKLWRCRALPFISLLKIKQSQVHEQDISPRVQYPTNS